MKVTALITTLVLGTSAAALAAPSDFSAHREPLPQDRQLDRDSWKHRTQWTTLASSAKIVGTKEYIRVGARAGKFDQLKLQTISGKTQIKLVQINFANGQSQTVRLNTTLDRNNTVATVSLNGQNRAISSIVVYGAGNARSAYAILAA